MKRNAFLAVFICTSIANAAAFAADPSPQPTTSPTTSGKLKKTLAVQQIKKPGLNQFVAARAAVSKSIAEFNALVASAGKNANAAQKSEMKRLAKEINKQAANIVAYSKLANNSKAQKLASQLIIDDDIAGRHTARQATAKRLAELEGKLALLEPAVYR